MRFCQKHWEELKDAIKARGLWDMVPKSGEEAARRLQNFHQEETIEDFDPLMQAHNLILSNVAEILTDIDVWNTNTCPICYLGADIWIALAADEVKNYVESYYIGNC